MQKSAADRSRRVGEPYRKSEDVYDLLNRGSQTFKSYQHGQQNLVVGSWTTSATADLGKPIDHPRIYLLSSVERMKSAHLRIALGPLVCRTAFENLVEHEVGRAGNLDANQPKHIRGAYESAANVLTFKQRLCWEEQ